MKIKKILVTALIAGNVLSVGTGIVLTAVGSSLAHSQGGNYGADRWDSEGGHTQLSCFFTEDSGFNTDSVPFIKQTLTDKLKNAGVTIENGQKIIPEAYSVNAGQMTIKSDRTGRSEALITAVGGDFFLFRDFNLLDGAYFTESDIMQDGAVIDRTLAWELYGSEDISGMNIYINGIKFYISGVIDLPDSKQEKKTIGDMPRAYISYEGWKLISGDMYSGAEFGNEMGDSLNKVTCYECIVPNPVENFAYNNLKEYFKMGYEKTSNIVNNTERFKPSKLAKNYKNLSEYAVADKPIVYPYWENASRITEFKLTELYFFRRFTYVIPIITLLLIIAIGWRAGGRLRRKVTAKIGSIANDFFYYRGIKRHNKKEQKREQKEQQKKDKEKSKQEQSE